MYILTICPSYLIFVALSSIFIQSATSHPIRTSDWVKADQYEDSNSHGVWKVFEKEGHHPLSDPPHVNYNHNPTWQTTKHKDEIEQGQPDHASTKGFSSSENPTVSVLVPALPETIPEKVHKHYSEHMKDKSEHKSELEESTINAIAADRQNRYNEVLRYMHTKNALNHESSQRTPSFFSLSSSSGYSVSFFTYRFSIPTLQLKTAVFSQYLLPGVFTPVIILLVIVWIAIFTIGLVELCNYIWSRRGETVVGNENRDEEQIVEMDELMKMPLRVVAVPADADLVNSLIQHEYEFLDSVSSDSDSETSGSDEDDYRIF